MALVALSRQTVTLVGWTDPKPYKAGTFKSDDGERIPFDAGISMQACFISGDHDFTVMKVKTEQVPAIEAALRTLKRGDQVVVGFEKNGTAYRLYELASAGK